jgi:S-adenosylmethionine-diacylgycerolhomoserine-N-methlytransferase
MDRIYRHQRHIYDLTRRPYLLGRIELIENLQLPPDATALEIGCGTAWNLTRAARIFPHARLYGFDVSPEMLKTAQTNVDASGFQARVRVAIGDATTFNGHDLFGVSTFDRVFMSYTLSMIPEWSRVIRNAFEHVAPGGEIHIVDFGDFGELPLLVRKGMRAWLDRFDVTPRDTLEREVRRQSVGRDWQIKVSRPYRGYSQYFVISRPE